MSFLFSTLRNAFRGPHLLYRSAPAGSRCRTWKPAFECLEDRTCLSGTWAAVASMPEAHAGAASGVIHGKIYICGGSPSEDPGGVDIYDPATSSWSMGAINPIRPGSPAGGVIDGKLYAAGGNSLTYGGTRAELEVYDPITDTWSGKTSMLVPVSSAAAGIIDGKLYVAGGVQGDNTFVNTLQVYDPASDTWTYKAPMPTPLGYLEDCGVVIDGLWYVVGGSASYPNDVGTLQVYDPEADAWTTKASMPTARSSPGAAELGGILYVAGGREGSVTPLATVESYNPATDTWSTEPSLPSSRNAPIAIELNGVLYVAGGNMVAGHESGDNSVFAFVPVAVTPTVTLAAANATYTGSAYDTIANVVTTVSPGTASGSISYVFYEDAGGANVIPTPTNAGAYYVKGHFASSDPVQWSDADSSIVSFTIAKAALTGVATTQCALNYMGKQDSFTIALKSITGLQGSDTVASVLGSVVFTLEIGSNTYSFAPRVWVHPATNTVYVTYTLRCGTPAGNALRHDLALLDASDDTGVSTSLWNASLDAIWVYADSLNYTFVDDCLVRLFAAAPRHGARGWYDCGQGKR